MKQLLNLTDSKTCLKLKKNDEATIERLENELKNRPEVLNIPPLKSVFGKEAELHQELNQKETLITVFKAEFQNRIIEMTIKHQNEIAEYERRLENLNKAIKNKDEILETKGIERILATMRLKELEE